MGLFKTDNGGATGTQTPPRDARLEDVYKFLHDQIGRTDTNALTNQLATSILECSIREGASDVHFEPQGEIILVRFRLDGELKDRLSFPRKDLPVTAQLRV